MKRLRLAAVLVLAAAMLAGCSEIPTTGPVQAGATQAPNGTTIVYVANPPAPGADKQDIVTGFLAAMSAGGDFRVARRYLTADFAKKWRPGSGVLVQESQSKITTTGTSTIGVTVPITAQVASNGVYTPKSRPATLDFHLTQVNGQWRIDGAQDGVVLTSTLFQKYFRPSPLQFFDQTWSRLVPDLRWFPVSTSGAASVPSTRTIIDELIDGPVGPLAGGVAANALRGATLEGVGSASSNVTNVTLSVPDSDPSAELADRMQQQLIKSLNLPTPSSLRLVLNDRVMPPVRALISPAAPQGAAVVSGGQFGDLSPNGDFAVDGTLGKRIVAEDPQAVTVSPRQGLAAVLTGSDEVGIVSASGTRVVDRRPDLIAPSMDQRGWVYSVPSASPSALQASNAKGRTMSLLADVPGTTITSIEVSPDGTRLLVLVDDGGALAFVAGIVRDADGTPTGLTAAHYLVDLGGNTGSGIGATWVDGGTVAVLVASQEGSVDRVVLQQLGGLGSTLGPVPSATSIVGTSTQADLRILVPSGDVDVPKQQIWQEESTASPKVSVLAVQR